MQIARGNKLYPYSMNIMVRGRDDDHLDDVIQMVNTVLVSNNFKIIDSEYDLFRLDRYMRCIPCGFNPELAQLEMRNRLVYTDHLASLLPFMAVVWVQATLARCILIAAANRSVLTRPIQGIALKWTPVSIWTDGIR